MPWRYRRLPGLPLCDVASVYVQAIGEPLQGHEASPSWAVLEFTACSPKVDLHTAGHRSTHAHCKGIQAAASGGLCTVHNSLALEVFVHLGGHGPRHLEGVDARLHHLDALVLGHPRLSRPVHLEHGQTINVSARGHVFSSCKTIMHPHDWVYGFFYCFFTIRLQNSTSKFELDRMTRSSSHHHEKFMMGIYEACYSENNSPPSFPRRCER